MGSMNNNENPETKFTGWPHTHTSTDLYGKLMTAAREMRKAPTPAENALWQRIRRRQIHNVKFRRQHSIDRFIVDFYAPEVAVVIEVDGAIHDEQAEYDALRQAYLESLGLRVLRFTNEDVMQRIEHVLAVIATAVG